MGRVSDTARHARPRVAHTPLLPPHRFVDTEIEADEQAALEKLGNNGGAKGRKRAVEDGFVGCALLGGGGTEASEPIDLDEK